MPIAGFVYHGFTIIEKVDEVITLQVTQINDANSNIKHKFCAPQTYTARVYVLNKHAFNKTLTKILEYF